LLIPGFNDSEGELRQLAEFIASVSPDIPWHVTAFHADYKMTANANTRAEDLLRAAEIGKQAGLRYIYAGNLPGKAGGLEHTQCFQCKKTLIRRYSYFLEEYRLTPDGRCPSCHTSIPGRWAEKFDGQIASRPFLPNSRSRLLTL
jgi:pyruvate formate lyase activating enzyme